MSTTVASIQRVRTPAARLEIQFATGIVRAWGERVHLSTKEHALLFAIARHRYASTRDQLFELVWGDAATEQTSNAFNIALHRLRRRLGGADAIVHTSAGYVLCDEAIVDLVRLEALARASRSAASAIDGQLEHFRHVYEMWQPSAHLVVDRYEWLQTTSDRARALYAEVCIAFGRIVLRRGDAHKALEVGHELLDRDECNEEAAELVIRALLERGNRSEALRVYRRYSAVLFNELGLRPSPHMTTLLEYFPQ